MRRPARQRVPRPVALTGTPGVGKSAVARRLGEHWRTIEVAELARRLGAGRELSHGVEVDIPRLRARLRSSGALARVDLLVGHLAHLMPVREAIVLRCHPRELRRRLVRARRGSPRQRADNALCEALDLVLLEALRARVRVYEVDTTHRSVAAVAEEVDHRLRRGGPPRRGRVDWLADRSVTEHLLDRAG